MGGDLASVEQGKGLLERGSPPWIPNHKQCEKSSSLEKLDKDTTWCGYSKRLCHLLWDLWKTRWPQ